MNIMLTVVAVISIVIGQEETAALVGGLVALNGILGSRRSRRRPRVQRPGVRRWAAVAVILIIGFSRGLDAGEVILLGITTAIAAIPSGLPTFLTAMVSYGAQRLAKAKAVVKNLSDVETLGSTSAINSVKTGPLTMDKTTSTLMYAFGQWFKIGGTGYEKSGAILHTVGH